MEYDQLCTAISSLIGHVTGILHLAKEIDAYANFVPSIVTMFDVCSKGVLVFLNDGQAIDHGEREIPLRKFPS